MNSNQLSVIGAACWVSDARPLPPAEFRKLNTHHWPLITDYWLLFTGYWPLITLGAALAVPAVSAQPAQEEKDQAAEAALDLRNPVATLVSVHLQNDLDFGFGTAKATAYTDSLIPVVPIPLSTNWNLITRTVVPSIYAESPLAGGGSHSGLGDIVATIYLSPNQPMDGWYWGAGPGLILPSATDRVLGAGKWSAGPTVAVLRQDGPWTAGALTGHAWPFASSYAGAAVSTTYLLP